mmetsp:Transcript_28682/g.88686  ORF Transcript_28682/g.88686 Transcript_28682/m.88686 type:complete len:217 (-) Transcript_28682:87-737(-)
MADPVAPKHYEFKIVLLGDRGVGKTCLVLRFIEGLYNAKQQSTIGAFFLTKKIVTARGDQCKIQIWDTAGQERFRAMAPMYYRNAAAAVVCFDVTDEQTFATMKDWVEELRTNVTDRNLVIAIACTKADLDQRQVSRARAEQFARSIGAVVLDTSAKENFGVAELFAAVSERVIELRGDELCTTPAGRGPGGGPGGRGLGLGRDQSQSSAGCCKFS